MKFPIRTAQRNDIAQLRDFNCAMAQETEGRTLDAATVQAGIAHLIDHPQHGFYLVAEPIESPQITASTNLVGCLLVTYEWSDWRNGLFWWIQSVYVVPHVRRRGVFRGLHQEVRRQAMAQPDVCGLRLYVEQHNLTAQHTYQQLGMHPTSYRLFEEEFPSCR